MDKLLLVRRRRSNPDALGLVQKVQVINGQFTKSEWQNIPVTIKQGFFLWVTPADTGDIEIYELEWVIHKRPSLAHVIIIPRLFPSRWRNKLHKIADLLFTIPVGTSFWSKPMYETSNLELLLILILIGVVKVE